MCPSSTLRGLRLLFVSGLQTIMAFPRGRLGTNLRPAYPLVQAYPFPMRPLRPRDPARAAPLTRCMQW